MNKVLVAEAQKYPGQEQQVIEFYKNNPQALQAIQGPVYEDKVVDFIVELATVEDKTVSVEDLLKPEEEDEAPKKKSLPRSSGEKDAAKKLRPRKQRRKSRPPRKSRRRRREVILRATGLGYS